MRVTQLQRMKVSEERTKPKILIDFDTALRPSTLHFDLRQFCFVAEKRSLEAGARWYLVTVAYAKLCSFDP